MNKFENLAFMQNRVKSIVSLWLGILYNDELQCALPADLLVPETTQKSDGYFLYVGHREYRDVV